MKRIVNDLNEKASNAVHFVVFDACRNELKLTSRGTKSLRQSKGFKPIRENVRGMLIAFATAEGEIASDVGEGIGPYARALTSWITKPGIEAVTMFRKVQLDVYNEIGQEPWYTHGALQSVYLAGKPAAKGGSAAPQNRRLDEAARVWRTVKGTSNEAALRAFAQRYAGTVYADMARAMAEEKRKSKVAALNRRKPQRPAARVQHAAPPQGAACASSSDITFCVSSYLPTAGVNRSNYGPQSILDNNSRTAWVEGRKGRSDKGLGEWIVMSWGGERRLSGIRMRNGYFKTQRIYRINGRVTRLRLTLSNGRQISRAVADTPDWQTILFDRPEAATWVKVELAAAKRGDKYADTAINELRPVFE